MSKKIVFCDIDGTLMNHHGIIPESTKEAIKIARANGHLIFLCTGRSRVKLVGESATLEVDGRICSAGGHIEIGDKLIKQEFMAVETIKHIVEFLDSHNIQFCLEAPHKTYVSRHALKFCTEVKEKYIVADPENKKQIEAYMQGLMDNMIDDEELIREDICKVIFFDSKLNIEQLQEEFKDEVIILPNSIGLWGSNSGEMMIPNVHKATGIQYVLTYLGLDKKDTIGYGDSLNDMEMLQFVNVGVAMGNACDALKEIADEITDSVDEGGIYKSFKAQGLLE